MTPAFRARRLRNIAWRMNLWQRNFIACCVYPSDFTLANECRSAEDSWIFIDAPIDVQILFVLFCAEAIEQGDI